nr:protein AHNAK2 [Marmota flaviventris]
MCDCFHVVLPTWPGAPGSVSGRQLQPEEPGAATEEDRTVTEGPVDEVIRPRPQGSSPVYECTAEGTGFGVQEDAPGRRGSSGRRRSWWKRASGDSQVFSRMSHPEVVTEVTLETEVEAGASGYSVTGGGHQGIFVKQVLKDSSAAKLFSLREGDQLLSATIFFDDIKYEDALKILQYSEPYKIQFRIKRKLPAPEGEELAVSGPWQDSQGKEQDKDVTDECTETPTKTLEADGDRERLISKPRESRGRRPHERLSWPKFQALKSKRGPGPRRSHSSSEAHEPGDARDVSPTSTDTEAQLQEELRAQKAGPGRQRRRKFLNFRFKMGSGQEPSAAGQLGREAHGRPHPAGVLGEMGAWEDGPGATGAPAGGRPEERAQWPEAGPPVQQGMEPGLPAHALGDRAPAEGVGMAARGQRETQPVSTQHKAGEHSKPRSSTGAGRGMSWEQEWEEIQSLETGIARLSLLDTQDPGSSQTHGPETQVQVRDLKTPKFGISKEKVTETGKGGKGLEKKKGEQTSPGEDEGGRTEATAEEDTPVGTGPQADAARREEQKQKTPKTPQDKGETQKDEDPERREAKAKMPRAPRSSMGRSPSREGRASSPRAGGEGKRETAREDRRATRGPHAVGTEDALPGEEQEQRQVGATQKRDAATTEENIKKGHRDQDAGEGQLRRPTFKMPSFSGSAVGRAWDASVEVRAPKVEADVALPSTQGDLKSSDLSIQLPATNLDTRDGQVDVTLPEATLPEGDLLADTDSGAGLKGYLPKMQMPSIKMPKVDLKGPQVDIKGPKLEVKGHKVEVSAPSLDMELPSGQVDMQAPTTKLEEDLALVDKEVATRDSKFKRPKFKMPSFGISAPSKTLDTSMEVKAPKVEADVTLPSIQGDLKDPDLHMQLPEANVDIRAGHMDMTLPEATLPKKVLLAAPDAEASLKGHKPKVQMPSIKMPKVDLKGPEVDVKGPKLNVKGKKCEVNAPDLDVELPSVQVDTQVPGKKLEGDLALADKEVATKEGKFKMPKFKMPSFGMSAPVKTLDTSMEVKAPKVEVDVTLPSIQGDLKTSDISIQLPTADLDTRARQVEVTHPEATVPEGEFQVAPPAGASLKGHLPKVQMPSIKMPKVDLKGPQVDIKGPKLEVKGPKVEVSAPDLDMELASGQVDMQAPSAKLEGELALEDKEVDIKDSKFKMPKFKMPSFSLSAPSKTLDTSMEVKVPKVEDDVALPSTQGDLMSSDLSIQLPTADLDTRDGQVYVTLHDATLPEGELPVAPDTKSGLKGHQPKVQMPRFKMPKVDIKGPQVDIKGPTLDVKGSRGEVSGPDLDMELPSGQVDIQAPSAKLEGDLALADKEVATRDSKFKMPEFKMPSFGISAPGKTLDASMEVKGPKEEADVVLPSNQSDLKSSDLSIQLATARTEQIDVTLLKEGLPKGELPVALPAGASLKGHLPKVQMPSIKMPTVDLKGPQVDVKSPNLDVKGTKGQVSTPDLDMEQPSVQVDIQVPGAKLEGDLALTDKEVITKEGKFKMPKFKMPSFGMSATGKALDASVDIKVPKVEADVALPSTQGDLMSSELSIQLPTANLDTRDGQEDVTLHDSPLPKEELPGEPDIKSGLKGHQPKVQMPRFKMPKVDLKGPQVDIKGPKVDVKGPKVEVSVPDLDVELPSGQVDIQAPNTKMEGDLALEDKEVATRDSKFKRPKFKMPSFGISVPGKTLDASVEVKAPKEVADVVLPSIQSDRKTPDLSIQLPTADLETRAGQVDVTFSEATLPKKELPAAPASGVGLKGHLPKVQMPSIKMPKVDLKGPQVDVKGPKLDLKGTKGEVSTPDLMVEQPSVQVDIQAPGAKLEGDLALADKEVATKEGKFKMPKFKMPSLGVSAPGKALDTSVEVKVPKVEADVTLCFTHGDLKSSDLHMQLPTADLDRRDGHVDMTLHETAQPEGELLAAPDSGASLKGHLPKVHMPSIKMPKVDLKGPKLDVKGSKGEVSVPDLEMELPSMQVDIQTPSANLEGDLALLEEDVATKEGKFKMPKFKMPSVGLSAPGKALDTLVEVKVPKMKADVDMPSIEGDLKGSDLCIQLPDTDLDSRALQVDVTLPEATLPEEELLVASAAVSSLKGHLPKVQMPSIKMPKVDLKESQVDVKGPKLDIKGSKGRVSTPDLELPSVQVDIQAPGAQLEGDLALADKEVATKEGKFKMPKFKMPFFGMSAPGKALDTSVEVKRPKVEADVALPSIQGDLKDSDLSSQLSATDLEAGAGQVDVTLPKPTLLEGELQAAPDSGIGLKGHLPKMQMTSIKIPKVDLKGPLVDVKGPKGEESTPNLEMELPSMEVDIQAPSAKLEGDLALADKEVATKDSKFKMPKFKMPSFSLSAQGKASDASVEVKVPKVEANVTLPSIQGDIKSSELSIQLPTDHLQAGPGEVDVTLSEAALPEGELPVATVSGVDLKGHVPKVQMPSIKMPKVDLKGPQVDTKGPKLEVKSPKGEVLPSELDVEQPSVQVDTQAPGAKLEGDLAVAEDLAPEDIKLESGDVDTSFSKRESELTFHRPHFKFSKLFSPHKKSPRGTAGVEEAPGACLLRVSPTTSSQVPGVESQECTVSGVTSSVESPSFLTSDLPFARADGAAGRAGPPVVTGSERPSRSQPPEACFPPGSRAECPQASCSPQRGAPSAGSESSVVCVSGPGDPEPPAPLPRVTFPKFHKPKLGFSCAAAAVAEADSRAAQDSPGLSLLGPVEGVDSLGEGAVVTGLPASQPLSSGVPESPGREEHLGLAVAGGPAEAADRDGKGSPFKMPRLKLPSFSWSPKKQAVVTGDPGGHPEDATLSLVLDTDEMHTQHTVQVPPTEAQMHLPSEKEGEKGRPRKPALAMPRLPLPRRKASKARESLPPGDTDAALSSTTDGPDSEATERASCDGGQGDTGVTAGPLEGDGGHVQVPQAHPPSLCFDKPKVEVSLSKADLHLPKHDLAIRGDSKESRLGDLSMSQSHGERMAHPEDVPTVESPEGGTATRAAPADSQAHWFRMPTLHVPGFRRSSSKEQGGPREQDTAEICRLAAPTPAEAAPDPGSMAEASVSPRPLEAQMEGAAPESESYADVPRCHLESPSLKLHFPTAPVSESGLRSPGGGTHPAIDPLPLQIPGVRPSEPLAPPGEARGEPLSQPGGCDLAKAEARTEMWSFQPKGPLKLKASSTDVPSQVSVVNVNQLWEDSVLTVTFPKLKVPRFSFPVPSSEADVFFPVVRAVPCTEAGTEVALLQESPGLWGASLLRASGTVVPGEQPEGPDLSSEVSPVSKVRVHIQESQGESQGVTICSNVQGECSDMAAPEAPSTQTVRESEIPTCTVQMPSYGFSLLKVKIPELPAQASTYTTAQDSAAGEHSGGCPGGDTVPGDPQPDTGEPFEMISGSANLLGPPTFPSEACSGLQLADSGSDEEPAEILEFPLDDRPEATTLLAGEDRAPKEKPEGKKSSGLLWSWLPNIGFSSTSETSADARDDAQRSAPIQTQPGARPDPEPEKKQDRAGWFRFPRLGFSSSPAKKGKSSQEEAGLPGQKLQEETVTFFDARESFSPEEEDDEVAAGAAGARLGSRVMVASPARTELILLEDSKSVGEGPVPRPTTE